MVVVFSVLLALVFPPVTLPNTQGGNLQETSEGLIVHAKAGGAEELPMILDTGATSCACPIDLIQKYDVPIITSFQVVKIQGVAGSSDGLQGYFLGLEVAGQKMNAVPVLLMPPGLFPHCLLGRSFLSKFRVEINGNHLQLTPVNPAINPQ